MPRRCESGLPHVSHRRDDRGSVYVGEAIDELLDRSSTCCRPEVAPPALRLGAHSSEGADRDGRSPPQRSRLIAPLSSCAVTRVKRCVESRCLWPSSSWIWRRFAPAWRSSEAKTCRSVWGVTCLRSFTPAAST